jgi:uncharacterized protein YggE
MGSVNVVVLGEAKSRVIADYGVINFSAQLRSPERSEALHAANTVLDALAAVQLGAGVLECSRARTSQEWHWDENRESRIPDGWVVAIGGTLRTPADEVANAVATLITIGVDVGYINWKLDDANPAHRLMRIDAVSHAHQAAGDFAQALGGTIGAIMTLTDAGIGTDHFAPQARGFAGKLGAPAGGQFDDVLAVDPEMIDIAATVEASYRIDGVDQGVPTSQA